MVVIVIVPNWHHTNLDGCKNNMEVMKQNKKEFMKKNKIERVKQNEMEGVKKNKMEVMKQNKMEDVSTERNANQVIGMELKLISAERTNHDTRNLER